MSQVSYNEEFINKLQERVQSWQISQSKSKEENWDFEKLDSKMDNYLNFINEIEKKYGVRKIGEGRDRITFTAGSIVSGPESCIIKVSKNDGFAQNDEEIEIWKRMSSETRKNVATIYDWDDNRRWIISEQVSQGAPPSATQELVENLKECGWTSSDISPDNIGYKNGRPVLIDLGIGLREI